MEDNKAKFKVLKFKQTKSKKGESESNISAVEIEYDSKIDGLSGIIGGASMFVEEISVLAIKQGSNKEKEEWQIFQKKWEAMLEQFEKFWASCA